MGQISAEPFTEQNNTVSVGRYLVKRDDSVEDPHECEYSSLYCLTLLIKSQFQSTESAICILCLLVFSYGPKI